MGSRFREGSYSDCFFLDNKKWLETRENLNPKHGHCEKRINKRVIKDNKSITIDTMSHFRQDTYCFE